MSLRSNDCRPEIFAVRYKSQNLWVVPRREWQANEGELLFSVHYRVPVLGTRGYFAMDEQFHDVVRDFFECGPAIKFYKQKLASYNTRKSARIERFYQQNAAYFARLSQMRQNQN